MWGKKGIMIQFLTTLILALIIFVPACYVTSKIFFRTSEQAKDNYVEFVKELTDFAGKGEVGEQKSVLLIMDEATAIVYFEKDKQEVLVEVDATLPPDFTLKIQKPGQCDDAKNCVCLLRSSEFKEELHEVIVVPKRVICTNVEYNLKVDSCNIGNSLGVDSYACSNGFMIERHVVGEISKSYYELPRRTVLNFIKFEDEIRLVGDYGAKPKSS